MSGHRSLVREVALQAAVALAYLVAAQIGLRVVVIAGQVSPVWLPTGVALWALYTFGLRVTPAIYVATALVSFSTGAPWGFCLLVAVGNTLESVAGSLLLRRVFAFRPAMDRVRDVAALSTVAVVAPLVAAVGAAPCMVGFGLAPPELGVRVAFVWWLGDAMGAVVMTPLLLTFFAFRWRWPSRLRFLEGVGVTLLLAFTAWFVFGAVIPHDKTLYTQAFLLFPAGVWAALRFGPRGSALATFAISIIAVLGTAFGRGPFAEQVVVEGVVILQLFMAVLAVTGQLLAAAFAERQQATATSELLAHAVQNTNEGVLIVSAPDGAPPAIVYANDGFVRLSGRSPTELNGCTPLSLGGGGPDERTRLELERALKERTSFFAEWSLPRADGGTVQTELQVSPIGDAADGTRRFVFVYRDVGERKRIEAQLVLSDRLASVGMIAAGVAHEINNPLSFILLNLQMLEKELTARGGRQAELVKDALFGTQRVRDIVQSLRVLSRDQAADKAAAIDVNRLVELSLSLSQHELRRHAKVVTELGAVPKVAGNEARLGQVILNLLVNALQALPEEADSLTQTVAVRTRTGEDGRAVIEVSDTGSGIPAEVMPRIFDPFFTTKPAGVGTGLGLFICRQIVNEHGGDLRVESAVGKGTTVFVYLPASQAPQEAPSAPASPKLAHARRGRVLIVDDEVRLANSMKLLLQPAHDVEVATSGAEALERLGAGERYDLILCDLQMPRVSGMELWRRLGERDPAQAARVLFISGGAYTDEARAFVGQMRGRVLNKPVPPDELIDAVNRGVAAQ